LLLHCPFIRLISRAKFCRLQRGLVLFGLTFQCLSAKAETVAYDRCRRIEYTIAAA
jgi:hypothetical protein